MGKNIADNFHPTKTQTECETLSISEAGKILGLGRNKAYEAVNRGTIPSLKFGGKTVIPRKAIDKMLENAGNNSFQQGGEYE